MTAAVNAVQTGRGCIRFRVRVRPGGSRDRVLGRTALADGTAAILVAVSAPPVDGRANRAVLDVLAAALDLPKRSLRVASGSTARTKIVTVESDDAAIAARLVDWAAALPDA